MTALAMAPELGDLLAQLGAGAGIDDGTGQRLRAEFATLRDSLRDNARVERRSTTFPPSASVATSNYWPGSPLDTHRQRVHDGPFDEATYRTQAVELAGFLRAVELIHSRLHWRFQTGWATLAGVVGRRPGLART